MQAALKEYFNQYKLADVTGRGIKVAVIDSGINAYHSHVQYIDGGISFRVNRDGWIESHSDTRDRLGHGTAVAAVLRYMAPDVQIFSVKIFEDRLITYPSVLAEAIRWGIEHEIDIINLSLGISRDDEEVRDICQKAYEAGIVIVSSYDSNRELNWPAKYESVLGICAGEIDRSEWEITESGFFKACGYPRELPEQTQLYNIHGHSFAAAHFSAWIARFLEQNTNYKSQDVYEHFNKLYKETYRER